MRPIVDRLPDTLSGITLTVLLQPGLWGIAALVGLAAVRAIGRIDASRRSGAAVEEP